MWFGHFLFDISILIVFKHLMLCSGVDSFSFTIYFINRNTSRFSLFIYIYSLSMLCILAGGIFEGCNAVFDPPWAYSSCSSRWIS